MKRLWWNVYDKFLKWTIRGEILWWTIREEFLWWAIRGEFLWWAIRGEGYDEISAKKFSVTKLPWLNSSDKISLMKRSWSNLPYQIVLRECSWLNFDEEWPIWNSNDQKTNDLIASEYSHDKKSVVGRHWSDSNYCWQQIGAINSNSFIPWSFAHMILGA